MPTRHPETVLPIAAYAMLGDRRTAALVGTNGSIDWLCLPRFDSAACFAGLLGSDDQGHWQLCPVDAYETSRAYVDHSLVLQTTFTTATGTVTITDAMPGHDERSDVVRIVRGIRGTVRMRHEWVVRFGYGAIRPWVQRYSHGADRAIVAVAGPDKVVLRGARLPKGRDGRHRDEFDVTAGDDLQFSMTWVPSYADLPVAMDYAESIQRTITAESEWSATCSTHLPHAQIVRRSLLTLRSLTHEVTGGVVAAVTTSLPEELGGERNWDYRYCWLRDAALTLQSLVGAGYTDEARLWRDWLIRTVAGDPEDLQIMYAVDGGRDLPERTLGHLPGYAGSTPVRIGNAAVDQYQADVLGEVMIALEAARTAGLAFDDQAWRLQAALVEDLAKHWQEPDNGLWEIRGPLRYFTHSRVMVWAAFDRAVRAVEAHGLQGPVDRWRSLRDQVRDEVLERGYDKTAGTFTQHYDTTEVDASLLMLPAVGFIAGDDPRMLGTIAAVERTLMRDGLVMRYRTESGVDGVSGAEHPFLACSFWLVSAYGQAGRLDDAHALFDRLCGLTNDVGLLSEEYDPEHGLMMGNFPQAFSHLALVEAALHLSGGRPKDTAR